MNHNHRIFIATNQQLYNEIHFADHLPALQTAAQVDRWQGPGNPPLDVVLDAIQHAEVLVTGWGTPGLAEALLSWSPETSPLRLLAHTAGSIHHLVRRETVERGLLVTHANESLAEAVAEFTLGAFLAMRRQMFLCHERYKNHLPPPGFQGMNELPGSVIGIIGASAIGRRVMDLLRPWGVNILLFDPYASAEAAAACGAEQVHSLVELFRRSDIISLHAPITPETIGMLRGEHFMAMKEGALFVNTARGRLVDHTALLAELQKGKIWAMLDVTDPTEPLPPDSPFFALENCVLIHHQAGNSVQARLRQGKYIADELLRYLAGEPLRFGVRAERMSTMA
jgi:phosphoglycerate dehydrogenase-like enzyme